MKNVAVTSCALSRARIRGTPTSGPYDWWLMGVIRLMAEMSAVSMGASASMSKVRQAAAVTPGGHAIGAGGTALLASPEAGWRGSTWVTGGSSAVVAVRIRIAAGGSHPTRAQTFPSGSYCGMKGGPGLTAGPGQRRRRRRTGRGAQLREAARSPDVDHG